MREVFIPTERLVLRTVGTAFAARVLDYQRRNREFFRPWRPADSEAFFTLEAQQERLQHDRRLRRQGLGVRLWVFDRADRRFATVIGDIGLSNIVRGAFQSCHLGYEIDEICTGRGLMTEALRGAIGYAFEELHLHRVEANIMPRNARSLRVVENLGFRGEGLAPAYLRINGVWEDHLHFALLNEKW